MEFRDLKTQYLELKERMDQAVINVMKNGQFIFGKEVYELEEQLADYVGTNYCISCANGTDAITLLLRSWGIGVGDAVFVPDITFIASAGAASVLGATPVFVDIDPKTFNISPIALEEAIVRIRKEGRLTPKAIIAVDLFGLSADYPAIESIASKHGLLVLEDSAQGFGGKIGNKRNCSFGDGATTSFFPAKPLGCYGDGGAIFVNDESVRNDLISLRAQGRSVNDKYENYQIGYNSRLDTLQAAILLVKLEAYRKYELVRINEAAQFYDNQLRDFVQTPFVPKGFYSAYAQYSVLLESKKQRDAIISAMNQVSIPTMIYYPLPLHQQKAFADVAYLSNNCNVSIDVSNRILSLPISPYILERDQNEVCDIIKTILSEVKE